MRSRFTSPSISFFITAGSSPIDSSSISHVRAASTTGHVVNVPTDDNPLLLMLNGYPIVLKNAMNSSSGFLSLGQAKLGSTFWNRNVVMVKKSFCEGPSRILGDSAEETIGVRHGGGGDTVEGAASKKKTKQNQTLAYVASSHATTNN